MEPAERLAAYLAEELSADERTALEAELARDAGLRAQLAAMRRADAALADEAATVLPDGARERLLAAVTPVLDEVFDAAVPAAGGRSGADATDQLATRRAAANRRSWVVGLGSVAAAIAAVAVIVPALGGMGGADESGVAADAPAEDVATLSTEGSADDAGAETEAGGAAVDDGLPAPVGPTLLDSGRTLDLDAAEQLLAAGELDAVIDQGLLTDDAVALATTWLAAYGAEASLLQGVSPATGDGTADTEAADTEPADDTGEAASTEDAADEPMQDRAQAPSPDVSVEFGSADLQLFGDIDDDARDDVARCLTTLSTTRGLFVPVLAELVTFEGEPAVAVAVVRQGVDGTLSQRELWVVDRASCEVVEELQG